MATLDDKSSDVRKDDKKVEKARAGGPSGDPLIDAIRKRGGGK